MLPVSFGLLESLPDPCSYVCSYPHLNPQPLLTLTSFHALGILSFPRAFPRKSFGIKIIQDTSTFSSSRFAVGALRVPPCFVSLSPARQTTCGEARRATPRLTEVMRWQAFVAFPALACHTLNWFCVDYVCRPTQFAVSLKTRRICLRLVEAFSTFQETALCA